MTAVAAVLWAVVAVPSRAQTAQSPTCVGEMTRLCSGAYAGGRESLQACLRAHEEQLGDLCKKPEPAPPARKRRPARKTAPEVAASSAAVSGVKTEPKPAEQAPRGVARKAPPRPPAETAEDAPPSAALLDACANEKGLFCNDVPPAALSKCLSGRADDLGSRCRAALGH